MNFKPETNIDPSRRAARRTAWILGAIAVAFFILSILDQFFAAHR